MQMQALQKQSKRNRNIEIEVDAMLINSAKILPSSCYGQPPNYQLHVLALST